MLSDCYVRFLVSAENVVRGKNIKESSQAVVAHIFNPSTLEAEAGNLCEFKTRLVYKVSSGQAPNYTE